jgi:hypothetical protein
MMPSPASTFDAHALVVGIDQYQHLPRLTRTVNDARSLYDVLNDPYRCGYSNVSLLLEQQATRTAILDALDALTRLPEDSTALIFFSGHGARLRDGSAARNYLCTFETVVDDLEKTAISGDIFAEKLRNIPAQKTIVFFDVCHAGGIAQPRAVTLTPDAQTGLADAYYQELASGSGRAIIASCRDDEASWEYKDMPNGVFTYYLLEALNGKARVGEDGLIRVFDIVDYVQQHVPQRANQHPIFHGVAIDRNFAVAFHRQRVVVQANRRYDLVDQRVLREAMEQCLDEGDFKILCSAMNIAPWVLPDQHLGLPNKLIALIGYCQRRGRYEKLVIEFLKMRPECEDTLFADS